jgi:hypothetical protein
MVEIGNAIRGIAGKPETTLQTISGAAESGRGIKNTPPKSS